MGSNILKKILATAMVFQIAYTPLAFAAEVPADIQAASDNFQQAKAEAMKQMENPNGATQTNSAEAYVQALTQARKQQLNNYQQQVNQGTDNAGSETYIVYGAYQQPVVLTKNHCYNAKDKEEQQMCMYQTTQVCSSVERNKDGTIKSRSDCISVPLANAGEYLSSEGIMPVDATAIMNAKAQDETLNDVSQSASAMNNVLTQWNMSRVSGNNDTASLIMNAVAAFLSMSQNNEDTEVVHKKVTRSADTETEPKKVTTGTGEKEILQVSNIIASKFNVKINPELPLVDDGKNVQITLTPKNANANYQFVKMTVEIPYAFDNQNSRFEQEILLSVPIDVELGNYQKIVGYRTVGVSWVENGKQYSGTFKYYVGEMMSVLTNDEMPNSKTVLGLSLNKDILEFSNATAAVAGEIVDMKYNNGNCIVTIKDGNQVFDNSAVVDISSAKIDASQCNKNNIGKYINMTDVKVNQSYDGSQTIFTDESPSTTILDADGYVMEINKGILNNNNVNATLGTDIITGQDGDNLIINGNSLGSLLFSTSDGNVSIPYTLSEDGSVDVYLGDGSSQTNKIMMDKFNSLGIYPEDLSISVEEDGSVTGQFVRTDGSVINSVENVYIENNKSSGGPTKGSKSEIANHSKYATEKPTDDIPKMF